MTVRIFECNESGDLTLLERKIVTGSDEEVEPILREAAAVFDHPERAHKALLAIDPTTREEEIITRAVYDPRKHPEVTFLEPLVGG